MTTIQVKGGTQALHRAEEVEVVVGRDSVVVRRPSLLGAVLLKARAVTGIPGRRAVHVRDLVLLLGLIDDPRELATVGKLKSTEQVWLRKAGRYIDWDAPATTAEIDAAQRTKARQALELLTG